MLYFDSLYMNEYEIIIGVDPGISGAISIIENLKRPKVSVHGTPTTTEVKVVKKKKRYIKHYDLKAMSELIKPYVGKNVLIYMEKVHAMTGQGVTSMFSFGRGVGIWEGIFAAHGLDYEEVSPSIWKKEYGDRLIQKPLPKPEELKLKPAELKKLTEDEKERIAKIKKEYESEKRKAKEGAKDAARDLAKELYPELEDEFKLKKDSDKAEALLIAERKRRELNAQGKIRKR